MYTHFLCTSLQSESCILARVDANHARNTSFPSPTCPRHTFRFDVGKPSKRHADDDNRAVCKTSYVSLAHCLFHSHMSHVPYALYFACLIPTVTSSLSSLTSSSGIYSVIRSKPFPSKSKPLRCALCGLDRSVSTGLVGFEVSKIGGLRGSYGPAIISFATCLADCCRLGTVSGGYVFVR
jgi:hypothetical protein